ncbi:hypothetical protein P5673_025614 [Acropora cervicornis]|uniref:Uncharacterized protein n=1 Tax=Acropora cervicornis TaxID=6130 RepID=A0AAD9UXA9_ACRCE|nr:hypothetical protein P5673_025614 [Acropora cervicornis]
MSCLGQMPANLQEKSLKLVQRIVHSETIKGLNTKKNKRKSYTGVTDIVFFASWRKILLVEARKTGWNCATIRLHVTAGIDGHRHQHHEETV